jgi:hypothetical protein
MSRRRDKRESAALKHLTQRHLASAFELGAAAVRDETEHARIVFKERLGFKIGQQFVKRGIARVTRENRFEWVPPAT